MAPPLDVHTDSHKYGAVPLEGEEPKITRLEMEQPERYHPYLAVHKACLLTPVFIVSLCYRIKSKSNN